ncbi:myosin light chain kinase 2, skeletal/cardiac muscle, partial [Hoplias malabaricus]|uniref:myosin light chain kinase 2, skeletal/cardiac muscle n=1 Tax=Hoplias malabaricus TaxID=27720 RepID=UPI0034623749
PDGPFLLGMRSVKCPTPDPVALDLRMDELHKKLDLLLSRSSGGGHCPMCGVCSIHSKQQETTVSQLSAHGKLLETLDRKVTEVKTALEELAHGLEDMSSDRMSVPTVALQRRKSLPVRTSVDEVYVRLDLPREKILPQACNAPCGKGQTDVLTEDSEGECQKGEGQPNRDEPVGVKNQHKPQPYKEVNKDLNRSAVALCLAALQPSNAPTSVAKTDRTVPSLSQKSPSPTKTVPKTAVTKRPSTPKMTEVAAPVKTTFSPIALTSTTSKNTTSGSTAPISNDMSTKAGLAVAMTTTVSTTPTLVNSMTSNPPTTTIITPPSLPHILQKTASGLSSSTSQNMGRSSSNTLSPSVESKVFPPKTSGQTSPLKTTAPPFTSSSPNNPSSGNSSPSKPNPPSSLETGSESNKSPKIPTIATSSKLVTAKAPTLCPANTPGLMIPIVAAAGSSMKHVHSCPESLQRFQGSGGNAGSSRSVALGTASAGTTNTGRMTAGGIKFKISPASEERSTTQAKTPPKTCLKVIDDVPPQPAPFPHRCVSLRSSPPCDSFSIHTREVLGGGRFGKVHKCTDNKTGLRLAAKIINARSPKEREMTLNEIQVMNQLSHSNILQLYDAFEAKHQVVLILEYVEGGELFERIVDESSPLTELDAMVFVKQICEGVQYMHHMYVLHLDLKPENILCVNRSGHQIKIIDFGLARRYKPREKLRVSFGTPEFLAPEVVNFDFVSFPTDMWTLGVVTYMLLSGLSPFLGDDDSQTLNNVLTVNWYFDEDAFEHVSAEAKDFVSNLLIRERSGRLSAAQCLKHPWLSNISEKAKSNNIILKSQVLLKKYMARRMWKKNYIAIAAANRFKKISSSESLTSMGV